MSSKIFHVSGKRKNAVARATIKAGSGKIYFNKIPVGLINPEMIRLKIQEPILLSESLGGQVDIDVSVSGGGVVSQANAGRLAIAKALITYSKDEKLKKKYLAYDRMLLVADVRRKETCKPNDSKARAKRQKSYR